ncbi:MAG TPA: PilZ domain-containing protein [Vicinamibacterales bacterium]|nr:PilZ domain-containing protein [Vicinamibacterales bacterium]
MEQLLERPRAARYEMSAPVMYRQVGEDSWHEGRTLNVSSSGVLFTCPAPALEPGTKVEFLLVLPNPGLREQPRVQCRGAIVRHERRRAGPACAVAATIDAYVIVPAGQPSAGRVDA